MRPMALSPVFAFGGAGRDFNPLRTHAYICFHRFGGKVKICTIEGCRFCMYKALRDARGFRTAYEHRSCLFESLLSCFWMYWNLFHRTFFRFSTTLSRCGCNISRWGACGRIFMHIQLIFMHFILMVLLCAPGGTLRVRTIESAGCLGGRLPPCRFVAMCSRGCDNMLDVLSHSEGRGRLWTHLSHVVRSYLR